MKLVTRAQWGARNYRLPNGATLYSGSRRGVKLHYLGSAYSDRTHDRCDDYVRQIQAQHMDGNGWSDIGYSFAVCTHGYVYEGRGLRRRNSANGSTTLNNQDYAVLLMVGSSGLTAPTDAQLNGARDAIDYCRAEGPAGTWLGGHRDGYATSCPGDPIYAWVKAGAPRPEAPQEDDPMAGMTKQDIYDAVWKTDQIAGPEDAPDHQSNPTWQAQSVIKDVQARVRGLEKKLAALTETNDKLVTTVAQLVAGLGDLDPAAIVNELKAAIESIDIRIDADGA